MMHQEKSRLKLKKTLALALMLAVLGIVSTVGFLRLRNSFPNVSAVEASGNVIVYWDENCSQKVNSIYWGGLSPGEARQVSVFVRNEGTDSCLLLLKPTSWNPPEVYQYLSFSWSYNANKIEAGNVAKVTQVLKVSPSIKEISSFSFSIIYEGKTHLALSDFNALFAENPNSRMIYPSDASSKPLNCAPAMASDWTASAFIYTKLAWVTEGLDTDAEFVNQTTGKPKGNSGAAIVSFGGPCVNPIVKYAESADTPQVDKAPIKFHVQGQLYQFIHQNGSNIEGAELPITVINNDRDMFLIEIFTDGEGKYIMLCYGFGWKGTYAAGKYFHTTIYPNLELHNESWIIVKWEDTNQNGFVNTPGEGDTYTIISKGNW